MRKVASFYHSIVVFTVSFFNQGCYSDSIKCDPGWSLYNGNCYYFHTSSPPLSPSSWSDSRLQCQLLGGDLLSIGDQAEKTFIDSFFTNAAYKNTHFWIGLNDIDSEGNYTWSDNTTFNVSNWRSNAGEPNNYKGNEDCVEIHWDGKWNDNKCDAEFGFICEKRLGSKAIIPTIPPYPNITDRPTTCEAGWIPWRTSCYGLIRGIPKTWKDARADCLRRFGDLLVIDDQTENDFLSNELSKFSAEMWIGLSDRNTGVNRFSWVDGTPLNDTMSKNWRPGEPSNSFGKEGCVEIYGSWMPGKWNDNHCNSLKDYICEKNSGTHNCPDGWESYNGYCYQINAHPAQTLNWTDARALCQAFSEPWKKLVDVASADLVSITSQDEHDYVDRLFKSYKLSGYNDYYWVGLYKNGTNDGFHWTDGSKNSYQDWQNTPHGVNNSCVKSSLYSTQKSSWIAASCTEKHYFVCKVKRGKDRCYDPIGTQDYRIPDSSFSASSDLFITTPPRAARLYLKKQSGLDGAWCAGNTTKNPWLQIDFGKPEKLTYMGLQGKSNSDAFVTSFYLKHSMDGITWDTYGDIPPNLYYKFKAFSHWRTTRETVMNLPLPSPLKARYIRIYPFTKECVVHCCMRVEFYGCPEDESTQDCGVGWRKDETSKNCYQFSTGKTTWDSAESICMTQGGHLTSITSKQEREYIDSQIRPLSGRSPNYWIGLNDLEEEQVYSWSDRSPIRITNWKGFFPSSNVKGNCIAVGSTDGKWSSEDCTTYRNYICKKSYDNPYLPKISMNSNWATSTDFYWKMDKTVGAKVMGTIPADAYGTFRTTQFNNRDYLSFDGVTNYINVSSSLLDACISHPGSSACPHGISGVLTFKLNQAQSSDRKYLLETLGMAPDAVGFHVYIRNGRINFFLRDSDSYYFASDSFVANKFNHYGFSWAPQDGLKTYVNGVPKAKNYGSKSTIVYSRRDVKDLIIGRSVDSQNLYTKMEFGSLGLFEQVLSPQRMYDLYLAEFGKCGVDQFEHGNQCYEFNYAKLSWKRASTDCELRGGHLASVTSSVEQAFITLKTGMFGMNEEVWIGLGSTTGEVEWTDGSPVTYTKWEFGEPNSRSTTNCVHTIIKTGAWNDHYCYPSKGYICKFQKTIDPKKLKESGERNITKSGSYFYEYFGCKYPKRIQLKKVTYGSSEKKCFLDEKVALSVVRKSCGNYSCLARSYDFLNNDPCSGTRTNKQLYVAYSCVKDESSVPKCSAGYELSQDGKACYKLHIEPSTVEEAEKTCKKEGGDLASVSSQTDQWSITSMLVKLYVADDVWIGLKYDNTSQTYSWTDKTPVTYTKWYNKKPDPRAGYYVKAGVGDGRRDMLWFSAEKTEKHPFFCKKYLVTPQPSTTKAPNRTDCPANWISYKNYCYFYNNQTMSFVDASQYCINKMSGANLASIMDWNENDKIGGLVYNRSIALSRQFAWIGLTNEALLSGFRWTDGSPLKFINWLTNRPYSGNRHFCGGMNINGYWEDTPCYARYPSVCKIFKGDLPPPTTAPPPTTLPPPTTTQNTSLCPSADWIYRNGSCYYFSKRYSEVTDYHGASKACLAKNSTLVSVLADAENAFILKERNRLYGSYSRMIIGLVDFSSNSGWRWLDGGVVSYTNFDNGEPSGDFGMESCVEMKGNGKWNDFSCNIKMQYACKWHKDKHVIPAVKIPRDTGYCDEGWRLYGDHCYLIKHGDGNQRRFSEAQTACRNEKAELTSIHSSLENAYILSQLYDVYSTVYIGLDDRIHERTFLWSDQTSVEYTNWYRLQPSTYGNEDCVEMYPYVNYDGKWNDINCEKKNSFICKKLSKQGKSPNPTENDCPAGFKKYQKSCYYFSNGKKTFDDAASACQSMSKNATLISIHSHFEQAYVFSHFAVDSNVSWIGLSRDQTGSGFNWLDGTKVDYTHWKDQNVPSMSDNPGKCVSQDYSSLLNGEWVPKDCNEKHSFVCKISRETEGTEDGFLGNCSEGWEKFKGKCYRFFDSYEDRATWSGAREKCISFGGNLVTLDSFAVQKKVEYLVRNHGAHKPAWMGLNDREKEHVFTWSSGVPFSPDSYSNWNKNEPNDNAGTENCVEFNTLTGFWNDLPCQRVLPFVCEHSLECRTPLGFKSRKLTDLAFTATSYYGEYYPYHARINETFGGKQTAWCTNETDTPQSLSIDLGQYQHITRITTQGLMEGLTNSFVISYELEYSKDGNTWVKYATTHPDGSYSKVLPGNMDAKKVEGNIVDIRAQFLRFTPVFFKSDRICLRLEVYGCSSYCLKPLSHMANKFFSNSSQLSSPSTTLSGNWLCRGQETKFDYVLRYLSRMNITRIEVKSFNATFTYNLKFKTEVGGMVDYRIDGKIKKFDTKVEVYDLPTPIFTRELTIESATPVMKCAQIEVFGCSHDCDTPVGMDSEENFPNYLITARTEKPSFPAYRARLNVGEYDANAWCALTNDQNQYLQFDFTKSVKLSGLATQGFEGGLERYVTSYYVQWSNDGEFWRQIPKEFTGNIDGASVVKVKFDAPIKSRYVRIVPSQYVAGICMRVEFFGCQFDLEHKHGEHGGSKSQIGQDSSGLSEGGKIGLIVFFVLLLLVILIVAAVYYIRRQRQGFDVPHKAFENPVHIDMTNDEIDIINYPE